MTQLQLDVNKLKKLQQKRDLLALEQGEAKDILFTLDTCGHCEEYKSRIRDELTSGDVTELEVSADPSKSDAQENLELMKRVVTGDELLFPTRVHVERTEDGVKICEVNTETGQKEKCRLIKP